MTTKTASKKSSSGKATTMAELMKKHGDLIKPLQKGENVKGKVVKLTPQEILLDIGYKSYALVIEYDKQKLDSLLSLLKVGDEVTASVISPESEEGFPVLSLRRMLDERVYGNLEKLYEGQKNFNVTVIDTTRGGYFVTTDDGIKGFLPNSQTISENLSKGSTAEVQMIEFDRKQKRVIFSEKATKYETNSETLRKLVKPKDRVKVKVSSVTPYGIYVEFKAGKDVLIEGFIHISEVSSERVEGLVDKFHTGDSLEASVLEVDATNNRVNLSLKVIAAGEFEDVKKNYPLEKNIKGKVEKATNRGIGVILSDAKGFIQSTKIPTGTTFEEGEEIEAEVIGYDDRGKKILLSPILKKKFIGYR